MEQQHTDEGIQAQNGTGTVLKRRGILAAAATAVAAIMVKQTAQPVAAAAPMLFADTATTVTNTAAGQTNITGALPGGTTVLVADARPSGNINVNGLYGLATGNGTGVSGIAGFGGIGIYGLGGVSSVGVYGVAGGSAILGPGCGVYARAFGAPAGRTDFDCAVYGNASGTVASALVGVSGSGYGVDASSGGGVGVNASSGSGYAVRASSATGTALSASGAAGMIASGSGSPPDNYGLQAYSSSGNGVEGIAATAGSGVKGFSASGYGVFGQTSGTGVIAGVYGTSTTAYGIIGNTTANGYSGLTAITSTPNVAALGATSTVPTAYAAFFTGTTIVNGNFVATGGSKSAAVPLNGGHSLVYCVESPESWFEDFGEAKVVGGKAEVKLDPDFAAIVHMDTYHVFVTEHGGHSGLHTTRKGPGGFMVEADSELAIAKGKKAADLAGTFSWRVVAKRKDIEGKRLAKFDMPKIAHPDPDKLPKPEPPKPDPSKKP